MVSLKNALLFLPALVFQTAQGAPTAQAKAELPAHAAKVGISLYTLTPFSLC